ncbi:GatB/YqeY domain-containing protein [Atopobacter sp. AH10]|uniref:GatB/YqeY domain-containing protein n=1 Tax=Atopobacter sp. AH10 TaxID=2315861 RepID=UPI000EF22623|nr:GatB/YqeY domain-containing protein [Atopobacter sp. AH10]RLK62493.1 GatB/YqeY domain-containing protein [Atopobacter sp. AH10]
MSLKDTLMTDLKLAMKAKDKDRLNVIRLLKTAVQMAEIDKGSELDHSDELTILSRELKQRKESLAEFEKAAREDLIASIKKEIEIVESYMPKQLSEDEIESKLKELMEQLNAHSKKDFGRLMGASTKAMKGQADGNKIQLVLKRLLEE